MALYGVNTSKHDTPAYGVWGTSGDIGVSGDGADIGVSGDGGAVGVDAFSLDGTALAVEGRARFQQSGMATVTGTAASPKNSVRVRMPVVSAPLPITAKSMMTALLQKHVPGGLCGGRGAQRAGQLFHHLPEQGGDHQRRSDRLDGDGKGVTAWSSAALGRLGAFTR